jgi:hypothetical protein
VYSYVLRDDKNDVTNNYVSNLYVKRNKFSRPIDVYFTVRKAKDGKFYLINTGNNELYIRKNKSEKNVPVLKDVPVELERYDRIFFEDVYKYTRISIDDKSNGILFRYAVMM